MQSCRLIDQVYRMWCLSGWILLNKCHIISLCQFNQFLSLEQLHDSDTCLLHRLFWHWWIKMAGPVIRARDPVIKTRTAYANRWGKHSPVHCGEFLRSPTPSISARIYKLPLANQAVKSAQVCQTRRYRWSCSAVLQLRVQTSQDRQEGVTHSGPLDT